MDSGSHLWYGSNFSNTVSGWQYADTNNTDNNFQNAVIRDTQYPVIFTGSTASDKSLTPGVRYQGNVWSQALSDYDIIRMKAASWAKNNDEYNAIAMLVNINMTKVNKGTLRSTLRTHINYGLHSADYTTATWNTYEAALLNAATRLGHPTQTDTSTSALTTAYANLVRATRTATITHVRPGLANVTDPVLTFNSGDTVTATSNAYTGYTLSGSTPSPQTWVNQKDNITYSFQYTANTYTVTFDPQGGSVNPTTSVVTFNSTYGQGTNGWPTPTRQGYIFDGWYTQVAGGGSLIQSSTTVTTASNHTLYAKWLPISYTVTYDANGAGAAGSTRTRSINTALPKH
jgi:uncharacterized repeat protein (TIGR02543 family)